jgi:hypothetical protein
MTAIVIWYEPSDRCLWAMGDTRLTQKANANGAVILTDCGAKLLSLPVRCSVLTGAERAQFFASTFGFAFAGSALVAAMTFATSSTVLGDLITIGDPQPPSLGEISETVRKIGERYWRDISSANNVKQAFEAAVFGHCPVSNRLEIHHVFPQHIGATAELTKAVYGIEKQLTLGSEERVAESIAKIKREGDPFGRSGRTPKLALESLIRDGNADIGGSLSIGQVTITGFRLMYHCSPGPNGRALALINGIDILKDIGKIGSCLLGINGQA